MKAVIKAIHSADIMSSVEDFSNFEPTEKDNFAFDLSIEVGPLKNEGQEIFNFWVVSPRYLIEKFNDRKNEKAMFGKNLIIAFEYDFDYIIGLIKNYIMKLDEPDWNSLAVKISRIGAWEFEDFKE